MLQSKKLKQIYKQYVLFAQSVVNLSNFNFLHNVFIC
jgi:hypothetical protein